MTLAVSAATFDATRSASRPDVMDVGMVAGSMRAGSGTT